MSNFQRWPHTSSQHFSAVHPLPVVGHKTTQVLAKKHQRPRHLPPPQCSQDHRGSQQAVYQPRTWRPCQKRSLSWFPRHSLGINSIDSGHEVWKPSAGWRWPGNLGYCKPKIHSHSFCKWEERLKQWRHLHSSLVRADGQDWQLNKLRGRV